MVILLFFLVKNPTCGKISHMDNMRDSLQKGIGESDVYLEFQDKLSKVAKVDRAVLIIGERGSGK